jgi:hypothetical protein
MIKAGVDIDQATEVFEFRNIIALLLLAQESNQMDPSALKILSVSDLSVQKKHTDG